MSYYRKPLPALDEFRLLVRNFLHSGTHQKTKNKLFKQYEPLVHSRTRIVFQSAKKNIRIHKDELHSEGCIGLLKCINKFNPFKSQRLGALATFYIKSAQQDYVMDNAGVTGMRISNNSISRTAYVKLIKHAVDTSQSLPFNNEIIEKLAINDKDHMILSNINNNFFNTTNYTESEVWAEPDDNEISNIDVMSYDTMSVTPDYENTCDINKLKTMIDEVLRPHFNKTEQFVFDGVIMNKSGNTRKSVYEELQITPSNLMRIERRVKRKFRDVVRGYLDVNMTSSAML